MAAGYTTRAGEARVADRQPQEISSAPMSQPAPCGRVTPRWSVAGQFAPPLIAGPESGWYRFR